MTRQTIIGLTFCIIILLILLRPFNPNTSYLILALLNGEIAGIACFCYKDNPYSLHKVVNLFILFFFVVANSLQFAAGSIVTSLFARLTPNDYVHFQIILLIINVGFNASYALILSRYSRKHIVKLPPPNPHPLSQNRQLHQPHLRIINPKRLLLLSALSLALVLLYYRGNPYLLFIRGLDKDVFAVTDTAEVSTASLLLFDKIIRAIPVMALLVAQIHRLPRRYLHYLLFMALIATFPSGLSRNAAAMYWLPTVIVAVPLLRRQNIFVLTFLIALLVVFPFMDVFRYYNGNMNFHLSWDYFNTMSYDASQNLMIVMKEDIVTYGSQLLGVIFFWLPRSFWPSKPIGSGAFMAHQHGVFSNISMPYFGEGYINFGYLGIILFVIALAWICAWLDGHYWKAKSIGKRRLVAPYYLVMLGAMLFIMRGDLMSSVAYTSATLFNIYLIRHLTSQSVRRIQHVQREVDNRAKPQMR